MAPILIFAYVHLAFTEEKNMQQIIGQQYIDYANRLPAFIPPLNKWVKFVRAQPAMKQ